MRPLRALVLAVATVALLAPPRPARAADAELRATQAQLEIERKLLEAATRRRLAHAQAEAAAAAAVQSAAQDLASSLRGAGATEAAPGAARPAPMAVAEAEKTLALTERALTGVLAESRAQALELESQALRVAALEAALAAYRVRAPVTPLDGDWEVVFQPGPKRGLMHLAQVGTLVTGQYEMTEGGSGSVQGTFAAGLLRLERVDASGGRDAVLEANLEGSGDRLEGTWLATVFGRGIAEAGTWSARRRGAAAPSSPAEPGGESEGGAGR